MIPALISGAKMLGPAALPDDLKDLSRRNAIELSDTRWREDVERLIASLEKDMAAAPRHVAAADLVRKAREITHAPALSSGSWMHWGIVAAAVLVVGFGARALFGHSAAAPQGIARSHDRHEVGGDDQRHPNRRSARNALASQRGGAERDRVGEKVAHRCGAHADRRCARFHGRCRCISRAVRLPLADRRRRARAHGRRVGRCRCRSGWRRFRCRRFARSPTPSSISPPPSTPLAAPECSARCVKGGSRASRAAAPRASRGGSRARARTRGCTTSTRRRVRSSPLRRQRHQTHRRRSCEQGAKALSLSSGARAHSWMRLDVDVAVNGSWNRSPENVVAGKEMCVSAASTPAAAGKPSVSDAEKVAERHLRSSAVAMTGLVRPTGASGTRRRVDTESDAPGVGVRMHDDGIVRHERRAGGRAVRMSVVTKIVCASASR